MRKLEKFWIGCSNFVNDVIDWVKVKIDKLRENNIFSRISVSPSIGGYSVNDSSSLVNLAKAFSGYGTPGGPCIEVYFQKMLFIYEDVKIRMW